MSISERTTENAGGWGGDTKPVGLACGWHYYCPCGMKFQLDDEIEVSEVGFRSGSGQVFDVLDLPAVRPVARLYSAEVCEAG